MKIENNTIIFKSTPEYYQKEKAGLKCNTVRQITKPDEYKAFHDFYRCFEAISNKTITIINVDTEESFNRRLTDISVYKNCYIFSWEHSK